MRNMASIIGGGVAAILGFLGLILWWGSFVTIFKGSIPILLLLGGVISLIVGINEIKETPKTKKEKESE